ncbi:MAG: discoidin domain-containing protein [Bacteroidaceae bacterium]|nr:discoidin domain-containing protein [Bacteroidaceae bacterium]
MRNIFTRLWVVSLLLLVTATVSAQLASLEVGQVYRFVSARADRSLSANGVNDVHTKTTDAADTKQEWYVTKEGDYYVLRNLACGKYLKGAPSAYKSWSMTDDYSDEYNKFELYTSNTTLNTLKTKSSDGYGYMHDDNNGDNGGYNIVGWSNGTGDTGTHWTITKVDYTTEQITALLEKAPTTAELEGYTTALEELFSDAACVTPALASLAAAQATDAYDALPTALQAMVDKVYNEKAGTIEAWAEDNADDAKGDWSGEYAKKFRVQMYEPYSIAGDITSWLGINAHANNDNPTGIHVPEAGTLYVMVEGTIKDGASLRIVDGGHNWRVTNATGGGFALQPGLNVINYTGTAGQLYICYNVDTYNPDGATTAEKFPHKLSEYPPLKIHIEGGAITGYYNACGDFLAGKTYEGISYNEDLWKTITGASVDNDADWEYMETRANLNVIPLLAHRQILLFHLNDYTHEDGGTSNGMAYYLPDLLDVPTTPYNSTKKWADYGMECDPSTGKINIMLEAWDRIMYSELATMGLVSQSTMVQMNAFYPRWGSDYTTKYEMYDYTEKSPIDNKTYQDFCNGLDYSEYFNHHGIALGTESGYMYGGWDHCGYSITTYDGIVRNMANNAGSTWGPAHEIGHQHQAPLTLNGLTEVTNNLFSNIALWYKGMSTSRYNGDNGSLESVLNAYNTEGSDIYTNNIWALTHLYYRLWLYYHLAGNNTQFYPRLFELLRQQPMQKGYNVSGDVSTLHFYKLACQAAGEDLTEFFRAHGYFSIMDDRLVGDYSNSVYEVSQEMIDEAIAEVKEMGYDENLAIIFICDDDENATYVQHDGESTREIYGETTPDSDFGSVSDFINGNVSVETTYTATLNSDGTLTMSGGEGGVGFLVLNEDGEIVSFSNKYTFAISDEAAYLLATGKASVVAVDTKSTTTEAEVDVTAMRFALLQELIENAIALTENTSATRVGFYKSSAVENLQDYVTEAQKVIANGDLANLQAVYELLYAEYNAVVANEFSRVTFVPGSKYAIINKGAARIMSAADGYVTTVAAGSDYENTAANQWYLERDVAFRLKNAGTNTYAQEVTDQNGIRFTVAADAVDYNITETSLGWYSLACSRVPSRYMNMNGASTDQVITWGSMGDDNSQWKFILLEADDTNTAKEELLELSKKTLALVNEVATVSYNEGSKISLQSSSSTTANYIWSNAAVSGNDVDKLLDSDKNTFFHSQWNNSTAPADGWGHHISVDLGTSSTLTSFKFKFTTRNTSNLSNYPKTIEVYGSNVGGNDVANYTKLQVASGFATGAGVDNEAIVMGNGTAYRYLRFLVTDATGNNAGTNTGSDGMVFFHMSEFSIYPVTVSATVKSDYTSSVTEAAVLAAYNDAEQGKTVYNNASATLDDINAKKTALDDGTAAGSYTTLLNQYNSVLNSVLDEKKAQLLTLITNTNNLIKTVGSVEFTDVPLVLTTENLYCNDPCLRNDNDYSADYVDKLTDGNHSTYLHTDWDNSNSAGSAPHYLRVDMGEGETITQFKFSYTTRNNGNNCPTTIVVEGSNDAGGNGTYTTITTLTKDANGLPVEYDTFNSETITSTVPYRYIRFKVTAAESSNSYFVMSEFSFTKANQPVVTMTNTSTKADEALVFDTYLATTKSQKLHDTATTVALLDAAIADQQTAYDELDKAIKTPADLDKSGLEALVALAQPLYNKMATDGVVNVDYAPSALTNAQLTAASDALAAANEALASATSQVALDEAKATLQTAYDALLAVENANEKNTITTTELSTLIGSVETLLERVATTGTSKGEIALQVGDANSEFYIWSNAPAGDCNGYSNKVEGLIDVNEDGSANTGTFFGTAWGAGAVAAYTHYLEVDLGVATSINKLSMDYTTRASGYENQRPTAIKILGSNNKVDYAEVTTIANGLATGACEQWAMETPLELGARYRYIRFAVATQEATGYFNMSDFNLYSISDKQFSDYYSTADADLNALLLALEVAKDALTRHYLTSAQYTAIKDKLNSVYNDVNNVIALDYTTRDGLTTLITNTETLINKVATVTEVPAVTLTEGILYCNADNKTNSSAGDSDKLGVAALLDGDVSTHLHTTYGNNQQDDNEHHYIRVDMGENSEITAFKFSYTGRQANSNNAPTDMLVQACNTTDGEWVTLKTLTGLPTGTAPVSYESELIEMTEPYRYVRFMVTNTNNQSTTTYDGVEHKFFVMSEFGIETYPSIVVKDAYLNVVTNALVRTAYDEKNSATEAKNHYMPKADYTAAQEALQAAYDALNAATVADKTELNNLIEATRILKNGLYETVITSYETESVTLQNTAEGTAGYLYCNAPGTTNNYTGDNLGVGALLDNDTSNFLHTTYNGDNNVDGLDHYLRVDLGDGGAAEYIQFRYTGRSGYAALTPKTAVVEAANDLNGDWTTIATLRDLSRTTNEVSTDCLGNGNAYRYWRFMVTETHDARECDGHPYYALSAFNVYKCTNVELSEQLKYTPTIYIHTTADLVTEVENAITTATGVSEDENATPAGVETAVDALQAVYDKLEEALKYAGLPVTITTDEANPVLYKIISKRADDSSKVLQFDEPASDKVAIVATADNASYQAWYFMKGENGYLIKPFNGDGKMLGVSSTGNAQASASIAETPTYKEWDFSRSTVNGCTDYFYIYVNGTSHACLSHNGGFDATDKLGIWAGGWNTDDGGTLFKFVEATFENDNARYYQLSDFENTLEYQTATTPEGTTVGAFVNGDAYSTAYTTASNLITAGNTSDATACKDAYTALRTASVGVEKIVPEEGKIYRIYITPGYTASDRTGASMRIDDNGKLYCDTYAESNARFYFTFEYDDNGNLYMKNLHSATYLDEALDNSNVQVGADAEDIANAKKIAINTLGKSGDAVVVGIVPDGGNMLNCAGKPGNVVAFDNTAVDKASAWVIEEVEPTTLEENVKHTISLAPNTTGDDQTTGYSTLNLGYPVTVPAGVKAYIVTNSAIVDNTIELYEYASEGATIPANFPVILRGSTETATAREFQFKNSSVAAVDNVTNLLGGTNYTTYESCLNENGENVYNIYMLTRSGGIVAMRWAYENYDANFNYTGKNDDGGYVKCTANKVYLKLGGTSSANLSATYYFSLFSGTTDIDKIESEENPLDGTIYDLQGRKIDEVKTPGFYIVNGKKMYVNTEMLK